MAKRLILFFSLSIVSVALWFTNGCGSSTDLASPSENEFSFREEAPGENETPIITRDDRVRAFRRLRLIFLKETPGLEELQRVESKEAYEAAIDELVEAPEFVASMRSYHQEFFQMEGEENNINYDEPANLAAYLFRENRDFREILRAQYCVDNDLQTRTCAAFYNDEPLARDWGAGVVTTQGFLVRWVGAFNFIRTREMFRAFACSAYPDEEDQGLSVDEISESVKTFARTTGTPQCYSCHRTMNPRASLFYIFNSLGVYDPEAAEVLGTKRDDGSLSTTRDLLKEGVVPRYHQIPVTKLKDYAYELSRSSKFRKCLGKRFILHALGDDSLGGFFAQSPGNL